MAMCAQIMMGTVYVYCSKVPRSYRKGSAKNSTKKIGAELLLMEELRRSPVEVGSLSFFSDL